LILHTLGSYLFCGNLQSEPRFGVVGGKAVVCDCDSFVFIC